MYQLVLDIESYPQFLPWCQSASVAAQDDSRQTATLTMDRRMRGTSFTTRNRLEENQAIHMQLVEGPFRRFGGAWHFKALDEQACRVELEMNFEFNSRVLAVVLGPAFSKICDTMVAAFVKRANQVHAD